MRSSRRRSLLPPLLLAVVAALALLTAGALRARNAYLTRGIPERMPQPIPHAGPRVGLNVHLRDLDDQALEHTLTEIAATGVTTIKQSFYFGKDSTWGASDRLVTAIGEHGLRLVPLLDGNPDTDFAPPADPEAFAAWAAAFASRYRTSVRYYIIWDEPNLTDHWGNRDVNPAEYAALLAASATAIREADADAVIVAAPLAPTVETGRKNLADPFYLEGLYQAGAAPFFDVAAGKPYGFDTGPADRTVDVNTLNFSRIILLREVMARFGDEQKPLFAGNWGWNSLPGGWRGEPSLWGQTDEETQAIWTVGGLQRARREWPWMGLMFLENWEPGAPADNPRWGFSISGRPAEQAIREEIQPADVAFPGFYLAARGSVGQYYTGSWRFSPEFGADIGATGDAVSLHFSGTDIALRVRRADYRARLYVTVDGHPAPALPDDGVGSALVLTSPSPGEDYLSTEVVARGLPPGDHVLDVVAARGWDQWALNGFSVRYWPPEVTPWPVFVALFLVAATALFGTALAVRNGLRQNWEARAGAVAGRRGEQLRTLLTVLAALLVAVAGLLTWGEQAAGVYRRLDAIGQLAVTAAAASVFYVSPIFLVYVVCLFALLFFLFSRPAWGLAIVAFSFPFYILPKPMLGYRFSPVETFILVTAVATALHLMVRAGRALRDEPARQGERIRSVWRSLPGSLVGSDYAVLFFLAVATLSLLFTDRLDVATNEWRAVIVEPALFYLLMRAIRPTRKEVWVIIDAFVMGGVAVALYGLWTYVRGENVITVASGLARLRSIYGSPNNVALYLGRIFPFVASMTLFGKATPRRRLAYAAFLLPIGAAILLTFSKGAIFLGVPTALVIMLIFWRRRRGGSLWSWLLAGVVVLVIVAVVALSVPGLSGRLDIRGATSVFRLNLWRSSVAMFADHPIFGVGLDNFLYAYRGRYILDAAWEEPNLNHPHNIVLDFATRLGILGLLAGAWLLIALVRTLWRLPQRIPEAWYPIVVGLFAATGQMLAHGLVDHSFFLVDLAFAFFLMLSLAVWLDGQEAGTPAP